MKKLFLSAIVLLLACSAVAQSWVRINQVGYLPDVIKIAVLISTDEASSEFDVREAITDKIVFKSSGIKANASKWALKSAFRLDFSPVTSEGSYYITTNGTKSPVFRIGADVYDGIADYLLLYMRQQRCGDNPYNDTSAINTMAI